MEIPLSSNGYSDMFSWARPSWNSYTRSSSRWKRQLQSTALDRTLDRANVLEGHTGCVNALSWAREGELLLSSGDDTTVRIWRMNSSDTVQEYPFVCDAVMQTGHRSNIFNVQMLPQSSRIATVARDREVRVFDTADVVIGHGPTHGRETPYTCRSRIFRCHSRDVKRIITEESPDLFLTVSEDGTVRQHDLRVKHRCKGSCPAPLVKLNHGLSAIAMSPLTPYQFVVAGESSHGYLFDRRHAGRFVQEEWGVPLCSDTVTTCVRRFGRKSRGEGERRGFEHATGAKMASTNGHEVLISWSGDAVHLYSCKDDPEDTSARSTPSGIIPAKPDSPRRHSPSRSSSRSGPTVRLSDIVLHDGMDEDIERFMAEDAGLAEEDLTQRDDGSDDSENSPEPPEQEPEPHSSIPVIYSRSKYVGACNVETVKDVNFVGPYDELVASGSDDGNVFLWNKHTGQLHDILEGDSSVVNVIEAHPHLPVIAVSGIDTTVKLFAPAHGRSDFSRKHNAEAIMERNAEASSANRIDLSSLRLYYSEVAHRMGITDNDQCIHQ